MEVKILTKEVEKQRKTFSPVKIAESMQHPKSHHQTNSHRKQFLFTTVLRESFMLASNTIIIADKGIDKLRNGLNIRSHILALLAYQLSDLREESTTTPYTWY